jgi:hypothetical protein
MHRKLMGYQSFSVASMRMLFPGLYTAEVSLGGTEWNGTCFAVEVDSRTFLKFIIFLFFPSVEMRVIESSFADSSHVVMNFLANRDEITRTKANR